MIINILFDNTLTFQQAIIFLAITALVFLVSLTLHEFAHSLIAYKMGDPTPKLAGRLSLNPARHLDPGGFACFILFGIGWAKPVAVNPLNFKKYKTGTRLVSVAGVVANLLLGLLAAIIYAILMATVGECSTFMVIIFDILYAFMFVNSYLAMFNFLPIYPLDGFNFVASFLKPDSKYVRNGVMNGFKILLSLLLISMFVELLIGFDFIDWLFTIPYRFIFEKIALLGV